jgi:hypothetical protein
MVLLTLAIVKWESLDNRVPFVLRLRGSLPPIEVYRFTDSERIELRQPGKYWNTKPLPGGDFRVVVFAAGYGKSGKAMRFQDVLDDIQAKRAWLVSNGLAKGDVPRQIVAAIQGVSNRELDPRSTAPPIVGAVRHGGVTAPAPGLPLRLLLAAIQCFALAEERKYGEEQARLGGGRKLLARAAAGIVLVKWTSTDMEPVLRRTSANRSGPRGGLDALADLEKRKGWSSGF